MKRAPTTPGLNSPKRKKTKKEIVQKKDNNNLIKVLKMAAGMEFKRIATERRATDTSSLLGQVQAPEKKANGASDLLGGFSRMLTKTKVKPVPILDEVHEFESQSLNETSDNLTTE